MMVSDKWARVLIVCIWVSTVGTLMVWSLAGNRVRSALGDDADLSVAAAGVRNVALVLVVVVSAILLVQGLTSNRGRGIGTVVVLLLPWAVSYVSNIPQNGAYAGMGLLVPIFTLALGAARPNIEILRFVAGLCGLTIVAAILLGAVLPRSGIATDYLGAFLDVDKALTPWGLLQGMFTSANNLGQFAALALPLLFLLSRPLLRWSLIATCALVLVWSSSRGALIAAVISMVMLAALSVVRNKNVLRRAVIWVGVAGTAAVVIGLPLLPWPDNAFSGRGRIWRYVLVEAMDAFPFGLGPGWFDYMGTLTNSLGRDAFHGHNQFVHVLATGGLVLALVILIVLWQAVRRTTRLRPRVGDPLAAYLVALLGTGLLEVSIGYLDRTNFMFVVAVPLALIVLCRDDHADEPRMHVIPTASRGGVRRQEVMPERAI